MKLLSRTHALCLLNTALCIGHFPASGATNNPPVINELTAHPWVMVSWIEVYENGSIKKFHEARDKCSEDDRTIYLTDHTYEVNDGENQCNPTPSGKIGDGTWSLSNDLVLTETYLGGAPVKKRITRIDATRLELEQELKKGVVRKWIFTSPGAQIDLEAEEELSDKQYLELLNETLTAKINRFVEGDDRFVMHSANYLVNDTTQSFQPSEAISVSLVPLQMRLDSEYHDSLFQKDIFEHTKTATADLLVCGWVSTCKTDSGSRSFTSQLAFHIHILERANQRQVGNFTALGISTVFLPSNLRKRARNARWLQVLTLNGRFGNGVTNTIRDVASAVQEISELDQYTQSTLSEEKLNELDPVISTTVSKTRAMQKSANDFYRQLNATFPKPIHLRPTSNTINAAAGIVLTSSDQRVKKRQTLIAVKPDALGQAVWNKSTGEQIATVKVIEVAEESLQTEVTSNQKALQQVLDQGRTDIVFFRKKSEVKRNIDYLDPGTVTLKGFQFMLSGSSFFRGIAIEPTDVYFRYVDESPSEDRLTVDDFLSPKRFNFGLNGDVEVVTPNRKLILFLGGHFTFGKISTDGFSFGSGYRWTKNKFVMISGLRFKFEKGAYFLGSVNNNGEFFQVNDTKFYGDFLRISYVEKLRTISPYARIEWSWSDRINIFAYTSYNFSNVAGRRYEFKGTLESGDSEIETKPLSADRISLLLDGFPATQLPVEYGGIEFGFGIVWKKYRL